jgi:hypothetical protein
MPNWITNYAGDLVPEDGSCICDPRGDKSLRMCPVHGVVAEELADRPGEPVTDPLELRKLFPQD